VKGRGGKKKRGNAVDLRNERNEACFTFSIFTATRKWKKKGERNSLSGKKGGARGKGKKGSRQSDSPLHSAQSFGRLPYLPSLSQEKKKERGTPPEIDRDREKKGSEIPGDSPAGSCRPCPERGRRSDYIERSAPLQKKKEEEGKRKKKKDKQGGTPKDSYRFDLAEKGKAQKGAAMARGKKKGRLPNEGALHSRAVAML